MTTPLARSMGYQPALDGIRAVAVVAVMLYHAGFSWMHGGFFGVEVFFVVSGFLITTLLIEERQKSGGVDLRHFWVRRWRRLLPALFTMLVAASVWAVFWGSAEQHAQMRRDLPWATFYLANWGQIAGDVPYFADSPPLLRHLWSLAVEEQWYVLWPLAFVALAAVFSRRRRSPAPLLAGTAITVMVGTAAAALVGDFDGKVNFLYLSTLTRCSGLLLGAAAAYVWRPWRPPGSPAVAPAQRLDIAASVAVGLLGAMFVIGSVTQRWTYLAGLPLVSVASLVLVLAVVHPRSGVWRPAFSWSPLVEVGKRSYGLYLWSWPISRICDAYSGSVSRFVVAMLITIPVNEVTYRWIEVPIRRGGIGAWWASSAHQQRGRAAVGATVASAMLLVPLFAFYRGRAASFDAAADAGTDLEVDLAEALGPDPTVPTVAATLPTTGRSDSVPPSSVVSDQVRRIVIVGDSQAHSMFVNLPKGLGSKFTFSDGAQSGCGVQDKGVGRSRNGTTRTFKACRGWADRWAAAVRKKRAQVALVMIGAWDVLDTRIANEDIVFGTKEFDDLFVTGLQRGIDALKEAGASVALLEIACMRPVRAKGVPLVPERGDDQRVAKLNQLMRKAAAADPEHVTFITGPTEWCDGSPIATNLGYRWDGVHLYKPGAKLVITRIAKQLLAVPLS